jgi:hypothetical protein
VTIGDDVDADKPHGRGADEHPRACATIAQVDVRSLAVRPNVGVLSLGPLVGDRDQ